MACHRQIYTSLCLQTLKPTGFSLGKLWDNVWKMALSCLCRGSKHRLNCVHRYVSMWWVYQERPSLLKNFLITSLEEIEDLGVRTRQGWWHTDIKWDCISTNKNGRVLFEVQENSWKSSTRPNFNRDGNALTALDHASLTSVKQYWRQKHATSSKGCSVRKGMPCLWNPRQIPRI